LKERVDAAYQEIDSALAGNQQFIRTLSHSS
jgi:hypothetical protein